MLVPDDYLPQYFTHDQNWLTHEDTLSQLATTGDATSCLKLVHPPSSSRVLIKFDPAENDP